MPQRKCGLYGRVSTVRQALIQDGGLDTQFDLMTRYVQFESSKGDGEWLIHDRYREEAFSGKNLERPEFRRMVKDIEAGLIDTVIVQKIDRITRSLRDFFTLWEFFERHSVHFISLHEKFDTTTAVGRAMLKLILVFAELEREQTGERTRATMEHRARQGLWNGGRVLGYLPDPQRKGHLLVNAEEARIVRDHCFRKMVELGSAGKVVKHLTSMGIREPVYESRRGNRHGGGYFTKPKIIRLLSNPVYLGKVEYKGEVHDADHDPVVDQGLFDEVQRLLGRNRVKRGNYRDQKAHVFLLQGRIRCGRCGSFMTPKTSIGRGGKKHFYYQCTRNNHTSGEACDAKYVPAEAAEEIVMGELRKWSMSEEEILRAVREANAQKDANLDGLRAEERTLRSRIADVQDKILAIVRAVEAGGAFRSLSERLTELERDKASMEEELRGVRTELAELRDQTLSGEQMLATYRDFPAILDRLREEGEWHVLKTLIGRYVQVLDWHQDEADPSQGTVEIAVFEEPQGLAAETTDPDGSLVNSGASGCNSQLPERDTLRNNSRLLPTAF